MRVYKSPLQLKPSNMQKKSSINFVKNIAAPKQTKTQNVLNDQRILGYQNNSVHKQISSPMIDKFRTSQNQSLCIIITFQTKQSRTSLHSKSSKDIKNSIIESNFKSKPSKRVYFPYHGQTQIKHMISFIHSQIQDNMVYVKSPNIYVDYILGLKKFKVKDLVQLLKQQQTENQNNLKNQNLQLEITCCEYEEIQNNNYLRNFQIIKCVGSGGFSKVYLVRGFGKLMAMKVINKDFIISNDKANIVNNEKTILSICSDHPFITKLEVSFQTKNFLMFAMQFCNGGELFNLLRKVRRMKEEDAKFYFVETLSAIVHLHRKGIVYRDIKPENIIIDHEGHVRLADFGLSKIMEDTREGKTYSFCGSAEYMAPEMLLKKGHSFEIDFYCLGALLYELVIGLPPYYSRNQNELFSNIIYNELQFPGHVSLSNELKTFLQRLLQKQVQNRYKTIEEILSDPWMRNIKLEDVLDKRLKPPFQTDMFEYNFDDNDFADEEKEITQKLRDQQQFPVFEDMKFPNFFYESREISDIKSVISKFKQQGLFVRSANNNVGEFIAESYHSREISKNGSIVMVNKHSREPSMNKLEHSNLINLGARSQITRRVDMNQMFNEQNPINKVIYYPTNPKPLLHTVRSAEHINTSKSSILNHSQQRLDSIPRKPSVPYNNNANIYTTHKQAFHPFGVKIGSTSSLISSNHPKSVTYVRQPNYYSVQKSSNRGDGVRLDIQDLRIKNQRNYSMEKIRQTYSTSNLSHSIIPQNSSSFLKHTVSAHELKKSYMDGFRDKYVPGKVKKSYKNGQKISLTALNNLHYRN